MTHNLQKKAKKRKNRSAKKVRQGMPLKYSPTEVGHAIVLHRGILAEAARYLGTNRETIDRYRKKYKVVAEAVKRARAHTLDMVEGKLIHNIEMGDPDSIKYYLNNMGKERGYNRANFTGLYNLHTLTTEQLERLANGEAIEAILAAYEA